MAGNIVVHILGDTTNFTRALSRTQQKLQSLRTAMTDVNKAVAMAGMVLGATAAAGVGAGVIAGGVLAGGFMAAAGAATFLAFQSEEVKSAFEGAKGTWKSLSAEFTKPMQPGLIAFFDRITDAFKKMGPSITRVSEAMVPFMEQMGNRIQPVAEKLGTFLEAAFEAGVEPMNAMVDGIGILADGFTAFFKTIDSGLAADFIRGLFAAIARLLPILAELFNALMPVGIAILDALIPAMDDLQKFISTHVVPIMKKFTDFIKEHPGLITKLVVAFVAFKVAVAAVSGIIGLLAIARLTPFIALLGLLAAVIIPIAGQIKDIFAPSLELLKGMVDRLRPVFDKLVATMQTSLLAVFTKLGEAMPIIIELFESVMTVVGPLAELITFALCLAIEQLIDLWRLVIPEVSEFARAIGLDLTNNMEGAKNGITWVIEKLGDLLLWLGKGVVAVLNFAHYLYNDLKLALQGNRDEVGTFGTAILWLKDTFTPVVDALRNWIAALTDTTLSAEEKKNKITETFNILKDEVIKAFNTVKDKLLEIWDHIMTKAEEFWRDKLYPMIEDKMDEISTMIGDKAPEWIDAIGQALMDNAHKVPMIMLGIGWNIAKGLATGVGRARHLVLNAIWDMVSLIPNTVKNLLGIHSPSRLMAQLGGYTGEGFANGLKDEMDPVRKAAETLGNTAVKAIQGTTSGINSAFQTALSLDGSIHIDNGLKAKHSASGNTFNVEVHAGISNPEETGRAVISAIRDYERLGGNGWRS